MADETGFPSAAGHVTNHCRLNRAPALADAALPNVHHTRSETNREQDY